MDLVPAASREAQAVAQPDTAVESVAGDLGGTLRLANVRAVNTRFGGKGCPLSG